MRLFSVFGGIHGFTITRQPNRTKIAFTGSNVTLSWNLVLTTKEKTEKLEVRFGHWDNHKLISDETENLSKARRWHWNGDVSRTYAIAYQLTNAQHDDAGNYGIRVRVDTWPPDLQRKGPFSLAIRVSHS